MKVRTDSQLVDWAVLAIVILHHHHDPRGDNIASKKTWIDLNGRISTVET